MMDLVRVMCHEGYGLEGGGALARGWGSERLGCRVCIEAGMGVKWVDSSF